MSNVFSKMFQWNKLIYLKIYKWIMERKKKTSWKSILKQTLTQTDTFDNEALRAKMFFFKKTKTGEIPILMAF